MGFNYRPPTGEDTYVVQRGDSLYSIARKFGTTVDELKRINNLSSNLLAVGQILTINENVDNNDNNNEDITTDDIYIVKRGDTLYSIANKYNLTVDELKNLNNLVSNTLSVGQQLVVNNQSEIDPQQFLEYIVKRGDSLYSIANRYGTTVNDIKLINNLTSNNLVPNQILIIPVNNSSPEANTIYTVKRGDSLYSIAKNYGTTVNEIKALNNLTSNLLTIGEQLLIP